MPKIVFFELEPWEKTLIQSSFSEYNPVLTEEKLEELTLNKYQDAEIISVFIYSSLTSAILEKMPNLKFIATRSMGYDHIDLDYCNKNGIKVANVPTYGSHTVAEHTFALILAISRKLIQSVEQARSGNFSSEGLEGFDLFNKNLGVVGTGNIGKNVAILGLAFGMKVLAVSRSQDNDLISKGVKYVQLDELLSSSDIVTIHIPHTKETEHFINSDNIHKFKKGSILINTARGALVETAAVVDGLEKGILSGAGLDVLEEEAFLKEEKELLTTEYLKKVDVKTELLNHVLLTKENVLITPHNAFNSKEAVLEILTTTIENINSYMSQIPKNTIQ